MTEQNYYKILEISPTSSSEEIKRTYRQKAIKCHPDKNPDNEQALEEFRKITEAYNILINPKSRAKYDRSLISREEELKTVTENKSESLRKNILTEIKEKFFSTIFTRNKSRPTKGFDIRKEITVKLNEAALGCEKFVKVNYDDIYQGYDGYNIINRTREIKIRIYPGIKDGTCLKIRGQGGSGFNGGARGDLYVTVRIQPDEFLIRKDDDIHCELEVDFVDVLLGTQLEVPTVDGKKVYVNIPPCTQPGRTFRLKGKGFPKAEGKGRGDQFVKVKVVFPEKITPKQKRLLEQFYSE